MLRMAKNAQLMNALSKNKDLKRQLDVVCLNKDDGSLGSGCLPRRDGQGLLNSFSDENLNSPSFRLRRIVRMVKTILHRVRILSTTCSACTESQTMSECSFNITTNIPSNPPFKASTLAQLIASYSSC